MDTLAHLAHALESTFTTPIIKDNTHTSKSKKSHIRASHSHISHSTPSHTFTPYASYEHIAKLLEKHHASYLELELLKAQGFPLDTTPQGYTILTHTTPYHQQQFCFVDIETTGSRPSEASIIEIGAILYQGGIILKRFSEFLYAPMIPPFITTMTGITSDMLRHARSPKAVLHDFRAFLGQSVFVAHNVGFDYHFLSYALEQCDMGPLRNDRLCTIDLARRTIPSKRYGLQYLNHLLGINVPTAHRAYTDALISLRIFEIALRMLPESIHSARDLIHFSHSRCK